MGNVEKIKAFTADCYLHEGPGIRLMEAGKYQEYLSRQKREVMRRCGAVNPEDIDAYVQSGGFKALEKAVSMPSEAVVEQVKTAGLRDRGPEARSTAIEWEGYRQAQRPPAYVVSTRLGGPSEAWTERTLLEGDPFALIEGMAITAYALGGVEKGIVYIPAAYKPLAFRRMDRALKSARARRYLGENILGAPFTFDLQIRETAGEDSQPREQDSFVCGECGRALFDVEGTSAFENFQDVDLRPKPYYASNVESYLNIPLALADGAKAFGCGTKIFALTGMTKHPCLVEAPLGSTLADLLKIADGENSALEGELKAFQVGGPSGGIFPAKFQSTPMHLGPAAEAGWNIGSGQTLIMDERVCIVEMARYSLGQLAAESCDRCSPCGKAFKNILSILNRLTKGMGEEGDLEALESFAGRVRSKARCSFGKTAVEAVLTSLRYFRGEYEGHLKQSCPARHCKDLSPSAGRPLKLAA